MENTRVRVTIDGMEFNIVGDRDSKYISKIAQDLNRRLDEKYKSNPRFSKLEAALLTAINLSDELHTVKGELRDIQKKVDVNAFREFMTKEEALERILELEAKLRENDIQVEKYKSAENFSSEQLKKESRRFKESFNKVKELEDELNNRNQQISNMEAKLKAEEKNNKDNEEELKALRREINRLKGQNK